ncbi:hypothetical protein [Chondrinema litorale]|uniref:hypothetical protein n=1 Tax=Chondrinema litorale TaxID=2994555 RepID=UPI002542F6AA|nr:hypothetical protein [Chondrinema litorale]UZR98066.1 hypothetical protein OQ292_30030 [Chondrinema litorale]
MLFGLLLAFAITLAGTYWWLSTKWKDFYTEQEMAEIAKPIDEAPELSANFYKAYDKLYPEQRGQSLFAKALKLLKCFDKKE